MEEGILDDIERLIVETDEENSKIIAEISNDPKEDTPVKIYGNYRTRFLYKKKDMKRQDKEQLKEQLENLLNEKVESITITKDDEVVVDISSENVILKDGYEIFINEKWKMRSKDD